MPRSHKLPSPCSLLLAAWLAAPALCGAVTLAMPLRDPATHATTTCQLEPPVFPPALRAAHASGGVQVELVLGLDGSIEFAQVRQGSGQAAFDDAALAAAGRARCQPFRDAASGAPVRGSALARFEFHLADGGGASRPQAEPLTLNSEQRAAPPPQVFPANYDEALSVLVRAYDVDAVVTAGMDKAFARLPERIGPVPKARFVECTRGHLSGPVLEQVVRPGFAMVLSDPDLMLKLARLLNSPLGRKVKEATLAGKALEAAGITGADALEANRMLESPDLRAFLDGGGLKRINDAVAPYLFVASRQARDACLKELVPPGTYPLQNERPA